VSDASWEQMEDYKVSYPQVQLVNELFVGEGGNIIDSFIGKKYKWRSRPRVQQWQEKEGAQSG
jgi:hypothetical protein